jgi:hypothetical protein
MQQEAPVEARGHARRADVVAVHDDARLDWARSIELEKIQSGPVRRCLPSLQHTGRPAQQGARANRKHQTPGVDVAPDEGHDLFVVHQRLLTEAAGHRKNIEFRRFGDRHRWCQRQSLHVSRRHVRSSGCASRRRASCSWRPVCRPSGLRHAVASARKKRCDAALRGCRASAHRTTGSASATELARGKGDVQARRVCIALTIFRSRRQTGHFADTAKTMLVTQRGHRLCIAN